LKDEMSKPTADVSQKSVPLELSVVSRNSNCQGVADAELVDGLTPIAFVAVTSTT
jgi:hypothetical protein